MTKRKANVCVFCGAKMERIVLWEVSAHPVVKRTTWTCECVPKEPRKGKKP